MKKSLILGLTFAMVIPSTVQAGDSIGPILALALGSLTVVGYCYYHTSPQPETKPTPPQRDTQFADLATQEALKKSAQEALEKELEKKAQEKAKQEARDMQKTREKELSKQPKPVIVPQNNNPIIPEQKPTDGNSSFDYIKSVFSKTIANMGTEKQIQETMYEEFKYNF